MPGRRPPVLNLRCVDIARHHDFAIAPCNVGRGIEKGRARSGAGVHLSTTDYKIIILIKNRSLMAK
jgi:hypothetical protein